MSESSIWPAIGAFIAAGIFWLIFSGTDDVGMKSYAWMLFVFGLLFVFLSWQNRRIRRKSFKSTPNYAR